MNHHWQGFLAALVFFTRLPVSGLYLHSETHHQTLVRNFPLAGLVVGLIGSGVFSLLITVLPLVVTLLLSLLAMVLATGAIHEDGFADMCDGFGGGWDKSQVLDIMKDSRLGSYGVTGLFFLLSLKFVALHQLGAHLIPMVLISAHVVSRVVAGSLVYTCDYVQDDENKKVPSLLLELDKNSLLLMAALAAVVMFWLPLATMLFIAVCLLLFAKLAERYLKRRIGGYTGDCLGGVQQGAEVVFYLLLLAML